jgi:hypothetical protein
MILPKLGCFFFYFGASVVVSGDARKRSKVEDF